MSIDTSTKTTAANAVPRHLEPRDDAFVVDGSEQSLGTNLPQRMGERLWAPMLVMGLMGFTAAMILGIMRADVVAGAPGDAVLLARLDHVIAGAMFLGFTAVLSAIAFAIARILGIFRDAGGRLQQAVAGHVQTLRMPTTAKLMLALMMMGMMAIIAAVIGHVVVAAQITAAADLVATEQSFVVLEAVRRIGVALHLVAIAFGLATIAEVLRFQSVRIGELAAASRPSSG